MKFWRVHRENTNSLWAFDHEDGSNFRIWLDNGWPAGHVANAADALQRLRDQFPGADVAEAALAVGGYRPRMWRDRYAPDPSLVSFDVWTMSVHAARQLFQQMRELLRVVEPTGTGLAAFGHGIRDLLILACTEVESAWEAVLRENNYQKARLTTEDYVKLLEPMRLNEWRVKLAMHPSSPTFEPFAAWNSRNPTTSLVWYDAYNALKHGRERNFSQGTLEVMLNALAAVFVMVTAQFGPARRRQSPHLEVAQDWTEMWADDFSVARSPRYSPDQIYVPPTAPWGDGAWTPVPLFA